MKNMKLLGFTLIELLIVLAVIAILVALAYPSYQDAVRKTRRAEARAMLLQLMQQQERYYTANGRYVAFSSASTSAEEKAFKWYSGTTPTNSAYEISGAQCDGDTIENCIMLIAKPGTGKVNTAYRDTACGNLMLSSTGAMRASGSVANCW